MVFITPSLFDPASTNNQTNNTFPSGRLSCTSATNNAGLGKRKRQANEHGLTNASYSHHRRSPSTTHEPVRSQYPSHHPSHLPFLAHHSTQNTSSWDRRPVKQLKRSAPKAVATLVKSVSHLMDTSEDENTKQQDTSDLRPCHACSSAPKRKKDLENFMGCQRCDERTCYICARECVGGCGKAVCKTCVIEVGIEGESWCWDCFQKNPNC